MIRRCDNQDLDRILTIINDGARAYKGVIPADRWKEPYMSKSELKHEIEEGVEFYGLEEGDELLGVMGIQVVQDVSLVRHAYVRAKNRKQGVGSQLLLHLKEKMGSPILIGTWASASWAIQFYEKHGFKTVSSTETSVLLRRYWKIPERQIKTSVVLADRKPGWMELPFAPKLPEER
jgi:N-acetylglutamate synthase-like GNAT family acetyltransferase